MGRMDKKEGKENKKEDNQEPENKKEDDCKT